MVAQAYRRYYQDYLKLPVTVAAEFIPVVSSLPVPDERVRYGIDPYLRRVFPEQEQQQVIILLTGRDGRVIFLSTSLSALEDATAQESALLEAALAPKGANDKERKGGD